MIVRLCGTLEEASAAGVVLDVAGVGYELGVSHATLADLPPRGTPGVTLLVRTRFSDSGVSLFGFSTREERTLFDKLVQIAGVGPKLALSVLSSLSARALAEVVATKDLARLTAVPGVGKKTASRLLVELEGLFAKDASLKGLATMAALDFGEPQASAPAVATEATEGLLSMGFTPQEAELALEGLEESGAHTVEQALQFALKRLGARS